VPNGDHGERENETRAEEPQRGADRRVNAEPGENGHEGLVSGVVRGTDSAGVEQGSGPEPE
jgi:hypothetical protein